MNPITISQLTARGFSQLRGVAVALKLLPLVACVLACVSCQEQGPPIVDTIPLGEGLKVIAYAVVGAAVLGVLGKLVGSSKS